MKKQYKTPNDWYNSNKSQLRKYKSEWIAFTNEGVIVHDKDLFKITKATDNLPVSQYTIDYIFDSDFVEPVRLLPVRFKNVKRHEWQPKYQVVLKVKTSKSLKMLVDSGADFSLIPKDLGLILGYELAVAETLSQAEGIGGSVNYALRNIEIQLDSYTFTAPVAWMQTEAYQDVLLGREVVFDLFDVEFKQADEKIIFKKR
ncbi:hypothetical protein PN36_15910 [Candidatus Thiomargarita nelsonii]|uniref:Peptidase A2 domain-containing protein n=1 Tax=Candidatus Thiomargarita nelsonii TaxID=1003181 RepID=A0A0A6PL69_9GAMM|nr:hypothetical protein PN36_15910 [Candidatus Thiomargarita nelsonii]